MIKCLFLVSHSDFQNISFRHFVYCVLLKRLLCTICTIYVPCLAGSTVYVCLSVLQLYAVNLNLNLVLFCPLVVR